MNNTDPLIRMGHPPPSIIYKKIGRVLPRFFLKVLLFLVIFFISFHFHHFNFTPGIQYLTSGFYHREKAIQEILAILDKYPTDLAKTNVRKEELAEFIYEEAMRYNHDPKFILALISIESSFKNRAVSERGAKGLMQIMPYVAKSIAEEVGIEWSGDQILFDPFLNIKMGIHYLSKLILDFGDLEIALTAYNYGPTYVKSLIERKGRIPIQYYRRILTVYQNL